MLKRQPITEFKFIFIVTICSLFIKIAQSEQVPNCELYRMSGQDSFCQRCMFGYNLDENHQCNMNFSARVLSLIMALKYMEPFVEFRNIFADFIGQYWFLIPYQTQSAVCKKLTQFIITINNERLWPFGVKEKFQFLFGKKQMDHLHSFFGLKEEPDKRDMLKSKRYLFIFEPRQFSFTSACLIRILCSLAISLTVWFNLQLLEGTVYMLTGKRILEKRSIRGSLLLMMVGQLFQFVGFYGFYELRNYEGYSKFGMKLNIAITVTVVFLFGILAICLLPLAYYMNEGETQEQTIQNSREMPPKELDKVHRVMRFSNSAEGYTYYLIHGHLRQFCVGSMIGYFSEGNIQYAVVSLGYGIELLLMEDREKSISEKIYYLFRKGLIVVGIVFSLLSYEDNVHIFSQPNYSFQPVRQICLCLLYVLALTESLLKLLEISSKFISKIQTWLKGTNKVHNSCQINAHTNKAKPKPPKKKLLREPSIAQRVLTTLKLIKGL